MLLARHCVAVRHQLTQRVHALDQRIAELKVHQLKAAALTVCRLG